MKKSKHHETELINESDSPEHHNIRKVKKVNIEETIITLSIILSIIINLIFL
jgi:hypothetical protein